MGLLIFAGLVAATVVVVGFFIYGGLLGMAILARDLKRIFWPDLPDVRMRAHAAQVALLVPAMAGAPAGVQHCWDVKKCSASQMEKCPAPKRPNLPCWLANMKEREGYTLKPECLTCNQFNLPAMLS